MGCPTGDTLIINDVTKIANEMYSNCMDLVTVDIGDSVTTIGDSAFYYCSSLTSVTIGNSVSTFGCGSFGGCMSLTSFIVKDGNPKLVADDGIIFTRDKTELVLFPPGRIGEYQTPMGVTTIGYSAFYGCALTSITLNADVTSISDWAFGLCYNIQSFTMSENTKSIGKGAFQHCPFTTFGIGESVEIISDLAFKSSGLVSITIPKSVTFIGDDVFSLCTSLESIEVDPRNEHFVVTNGILWPADKLRLVHCIVRPTGDLVLPESVVSIGPYIFERCSGLTSVKMGKSVISIGDHAFLGCSELTTVEIPDSVTTILNSAFLGCSKLTSIVIPDEVSSIQKSTFEGCCGLTSVRIGNSVRSIYDAAFFSCSKLTRVVIPRSVTTISNWAFGQCSLLTEFIYLGVANFENGPDIFKQSSGCSVTSVRVRSDYTGATFCGLPVTQEASVILSADSKVLVYCPPSMSGTYEVPSVTEIYSGAFSGCSELSQVVIPNTVQVIGNYAFQGCSSIESITIPSSVTSIGSCPFAACSSLASIEVPEGNSHYFSDSGVLLTKDKRTIIQCPIHKSGEYTVHSTVTSISAGSFQGCTEITGITISSPLTSIGPNAFQGCTKLTTVSITSVEVINVQAFMGCSKLASIALPYTLSYIGVGAFSGCVELESITIPASVTIIGGSAYKDCSKLSEVSYKGTLAPQHGRKVFEGTAVTYVEVPYEYSSDTFCGVNILRLDPTPSASPGPTPTPDDGLSPGVIAGIVCGVVVVLVLIIVCVPFARKKMRGSDISA